MTLLEKYLQGEIQVLYNRGRGSFESDTPEQVEAVLREVFRRVQYNLQIIHDELRQLNYRFLADKYEATDKPLVLPFPDVEDLLAELNQRVAPRFIPLSLQYFYRYVGAVDFTWDWEDYSAIPWEGADPIVIVSLNYLLEWAGENVGNNEIYISPDDLHKDNISGDAYYMLLSESPTIDSLITGYDLLFIDYLRLTLENCGFSMADKCNYDSLREFCEKVRHKLLPI